MAEGDRITGPNLWIGWIYDTGGGTAGTVVLSGDQRSLSYTREMETADATAGADGARVYKSTIKNFSASSDAMYTGTSGSAVFSAIGLGSEGTLVFAPQGTAAGKPKGGGPMICTNQSMEIPFDDMVTISLEFQGQGNETWNPKTDVWA